MFKCSNVQIVKCSNVQMFKCSNVKYQMSNVKKVKLLLERTSGVPPVIFFLNNVFSLNISKKSAEAWLAQWRTQSPFSRHTNLFEIIGDSSPLNSAYFNSARARSATFIIRFILACLQSLASICFSSPLLQFQKFQLIDFSQCIL